MKGFLLTLSVLLAFTRESNGKPNVIRTPRYPLVYVGDDVSLQCGGTGEPIKWTLNGKSLSHSNSSLTLTMVTTANSGEYICERNAEKSDAHNLTVLALEAYAQLSLPPGGAVIPKGGARVLRLQVDEELDKWKCFAFRDNAGFVMHIDQDTMNVGLVYADLQNAQRATFWCKKSASHHRSNVVTLIMTESLVMLEPATPVLKEQALTLRCAAWGGGKVEKATFYKNNIILEGNNDIHTIPSATDFDSGQYKCQATYRYSHISKQAASKTHESDPQQIKVIDGPPAALLVTNHETELECSCAACNADCSSYQWHHTDISKKRKRLDNADKTIHIDEEGSYTCRADCGNGFSRFSNVHNFTAGVPGGGGTVVVILIAIVMFFLGLICIVVAVILRRRHRNRTTGQIKDDGKKDKSGGDYEQIGLTDKGIYHTLAEASGQEKAEGGYEALKKTDDDKAVYHTLGGVEKPSEAQGQGAYEALKKTDDDKAVYHTLGGVEEAGEAQGQGGYEALQNVKAQVYQTLSSGSGKPEGEAEGGYEQLPQKEVTVEENPYEELKADKQKKLPTQEKE